MRYVIIGASAAGAQAAEDLRRVDEKSKITIISKEPYLPYSRCLISRFVDSRLSEDGLYFKTKEFFKTNNIESILNTYAKRIEKNKKTVVLENSRELKYDKLLLATGSRPWAPKISGLDLDGVYNFHSLDDGKRIIGKAKEAKKAVVVGAGFVGLEAAYALSRIGLSVTVIERCSQILPNQLDRIGSLLIRRDLKNLGVDIITDVSLLSINGDTSVCDVALADRSHMQCDIVVMATGVTPNKELAQDIGVETDKGVLVDEFLQTSEPNIYAAGDVIEVQDVSTGKRVPSATWFNAVLQGKFAAYNMAGMRKRYTGAVGIQNAVQFHQLPAISYGSTLVESESHEDYEVMSIEKGNVYKKLVLKGGRICGMIFVGDIVKSGFYASLIRHEVDVSQYKEKLLDSDFSYAYFKDENFGQETPYHKIPACWESPKWWLERSQCIGI